MQVKALVKEGLAILKAALRRLCTGKARNVQDTSGINMVVPERNVDGSDSTIAGKEDSVLRPFYQIMEAELIRLGYNPLEYMHQKWMEKATSVIEEVGKRSVLRKVTDIHIAAAIVSSAIDPADTVEYVNVLFKAIIPLISEPKMYEVGFKGNKLYFIENLDETVVRFAKLDISTMDDQNFAKWFLISLKKIEDPSRNMYMWVYEVLIALSLSLFKPI